MDRGDFARYYAENTGLIHTVARKGIARLQALGAGMEYDDLVQEMTVVFIRAYDSFDEACGNKFSTYFTCAAYHELNSLAESYELERLGVKTSTLKRDGKWIKVRQKVHGGCVSVEELSSVSEAEGENIMDVIDGESPTPEQIAEAKSSLDAFLASMSPLARKLTELTIDPPEFIEREFEALTAHAEYARSRDIARRGRGSLNMNFVALVLERTTEISAKDLRDAQHEIANLAERF